MNDNKTPVISVNNLGKVFSTDEVETHALSNISFDIYQNDYVSFSGPSGCGKSTLLTILGLLDQASSGQYHLDGKLVTELSKTEQAKVRGAQIGFIFQNFNLIGDMSVEDNVSLPLNYLGLSRKEQKERTMKALESVSMAHRAKHYPSQLSGGQQQRVAIARAIAGQPKIILADEPTGNLDSENGEAVMAILEKLHSEGATICMVTHDPRYAEAASRTIHLLDGKQVDSHPATA
ncbi:ABC transporter ATP-binding protein [Alteromonas sp. a30]|uniref:ABC transporter ATP-binding protein n=1 Tax=Alteromonas sp. a30 TaxID=2730917 RepID=UPI00227F92AC|nr:ABC transporter ATP-binding protein [Alteromonas sp. a30]MCY7294912.1 ABC transporter ATP-binding protein [Alteromonas sp. a30]